MRDDDLLPWLLDTDPALQWRVERDLQGAPETVWSATRARVTTEGFGAALLARQDADGQWAGGAFFPGHAFPEATGQEGQPWTATTWSLNALREWGVDASVLAGTAEKLAAHSRWEYDDLPYWEGEVDACINAFTLANGAWLDADVAALHDWFPAHRMADGGWNCDWVEGSTRSSFTSTLNTVVGLLAYEQLTGDDSLRDDRHAAEEYLLERRLMYRLSTGEEVGPWVNARAYPFRGRYNMLHALDHFVNASMRDGTEPDPRLEEAVSRLREARNADGTWSATIRYGGQAWFEVDVPPGEPSPWVTYSALRVLRWWEAGAGGTATALA